MKKYFKDLRKKIRTQGYDIYLTKLNGRGIQVLIYSRVYEYLFIEKSYRELDPALRDIEDWVDSKNKKLNKILPPFLNETHHWFVK